MSTEVTFEELDAHLASTCGRVLKTMLDAASARAGVDLAARIAGLTEARLVIHAHGDMLQVDLVAPAGDGKAVLLLGLTAMSEVAPCSTH